MKSTLKHLTLGVGTAMSLMGCKQEAPPKPKAPNIIYILADDMGYGDVSGLNKLSKIPTPNIDSLIGQGVSISDAHSNSAVCTPTRYGILTGRYCFRSRLKSGVLLGHQPSLIEKGRTTVASFLGKNNYHSGCVGKWHLGLDWAKKDTSKALFEGHLWDMSSTENVDYKAVVKGGPTDNGFDY